MVDSTQLLARSALSSGPSAPGPPSSGMSTEFAKFQNTLQLATQDRNAVKYAVRAAIEYSHVPGFGAAVIDTIVKALRSPSANLSAQNVVFVRRSLVHLLDGIMRASSAAQADARLQNTGPDGAARALYPALVLECLTKAAPSVAMSGSLTELLQQKAESWAALGTCDPTALRKALATARAQIVAAHGGGKAAGSGPSNGALVSGARLVWSDRRVNTHADLPAGPDETMLSEGNVAMLLNRGLRLTREGQEVVALSAGPFTSHPRNALWILGRDQPGWMGEHGVVASVQDGTWSRPGGFLGGMAGLDWSGRPCEYPPQPSGTATVRETASQGTEDEEDSSPWARADGVGQKRSLATRPHSPPDHLLKAPKRSLSDSFGFQSELDSPLGLDDLSEGTPQLTSSAASRRRSAVGTDLDSRPSQQATEARAAPGQAAAAAQGTPVKAASRGGALPDDDKARRKAAIARLLHAGSTAPATEPPPLPEDGPEPDLGVGGPPASGGGAGAAASQPVELPPPLFPPPQPLAAGQGMPGMPGMPALPGPPGMQGAMAPEMASMQGVVPAAWANAGPAGMAGPQAMQMGNGAWVGPGVAPNGVVSQGWGREGHAAPMAQPMGFNGGMGMMGQMERPPFVGVMPGGPMPGPPMAMGGPGMGPMGPNGMGHMGMPGGPGGMHRMGMGGPGVGGPFGMPGPRPGMGPPGFGPPFPQPGMHGPGKPFPGPGSMPGDFRGGPPVRGMGFSRRGRGYRR